MKVEVWGTVEYRKVVEVDDECVLYEDVYDDACDKLVIGKEDLGDIVDVNVVYDESEREQEKEE